MDSFDVDISGWEAEGGSLGILPEPNLYPRSARMLAIDDFMNSQPMILVLNLLIATIVASAVTFIGYRVWDLVQFILALIGGR